MFALSHDAVLPYDISHRALSMFHEWGHQESQDLDSQRIPVNPLKSSKSPVDFIGIYWNVTGNGLEFTGSLLDVTGI